MGPNSQELREEAVVVLSQLAQSPGWALYRARLQSLSKSSEKEKAVSLRCGKYAEAAWAQGIVDGLEMAMGELKPYIARLEHREVNLPSGSGQED